MITLIEYDRASKPTGRLCRMPDVDRRDLQDLITLYGLTATSNDYTGIVDGYSAERWCFCYQSSMGHHPGEPVELVELLTERKHP